jgi:HEPN domain-containing protein
MVDWKDFRKQRQSDMAACDLLYESGDYVNAAYHLQQAVEKHTKYILLHGKLMSERERTHLPISEFLEEFVDMMNNFNIIAEKYKNQFLDAQNLRERRIQFIDQTRIIMKALTPKERKRSYLCALWKNSLNILLVDMQEEAVFQRCSAVLCP